MGDLSVMCCITEQCQLPPLEGAPKCKICNKGSDANINADFKFGDDNGIFDVPKIFNDTFWLYYMVCCGLGVSMPLQGDRPLWASRRKFLIDRYRMLSLEPVPDTAIKTKSIHIHLQLATTWKQIASEGRAAWQRRMSPRALTVLCLAIACRPLQRGVCRVGNCTNVPLIVRTALVACARRWAESRFTHYDVVS